MFGLMRVRTHDAEMAKVQEVAGNLDAVANKYKALAERAVADLRETRLILESAYVRGPKGHFQRATLPTPPETTA